MIETISYILGSSVVTSVITTLINRKSMKIEEAGKTIENEAKIDELWQKRFSYMDVIIEKMEKLACQKTNCKDRI